MQKGAAQRSFVQFLDVTFDSGVDVGALIADERIQLRRFELDGTGTGDLVGLAGTATQAADTLMFDFGGEGIGGDHNTDIGDGYYELAFDLDSNRSLESTLNFYRLLGDVNGDRTVDQLDLLAIDAAMRSTGSNLDEDANGDGRVNHIDRVLTARADGRSLGVGLSIDD